MNSRFRPGYNIFFWFLFFVQFFREKTKIQNGTDCCATSKIYSIIYGRKTLMKNNPKESFSNVARISADRI